MRMYDVIMNKRNGKALSKEEIDFFIEGFNDGSIPDYQASALMMAIYFNSMNKEETANLTMAMAHSGDILDLSKIDGIKVDKHSTGGVGDSVSLVLAPLVASLGVPVAKMSGRGLGHTGGTIDKLETFENFSIDIPIEEFIDNVNNIKVSIVGQTADLAPADKKIYALRDVTATVDNMSLIASSIMSKKIASGADCIVLDVKVGSGAFMKNLDDATELASEMVSIGNNLNKKTVAIISDMEQPLGFAVGNALEIKEVIDTLKGNGPDDLLELVLELGSFMVHLGGRASTLKEARNLLEENIKNGLGLLKLKEFIKMQGGDTSIIDDTSLIPKAAYILELKAKSNGYVCEMKAEPIGMLSMELGAGRLTKTDLIDLYVGIVLNKKIGSQVSIGDTLAYIHCNDITKGRLAVEKLSEIIKISNKKIKTPLIHKIIK